MTTKPQKICPLCLCWHAPRCRATPAGTRWPLEPLIEAAGGRVALSQNLDNVNLTRAAREGLTDVQADRWAVRSGFHPSQIWPDWTDAALRYVDAAAVEGSRQAWLHREAHSTRTKAA